MRSSQLEELNLTGCRFLMQMSLHSVPSAGTSCMSLISQIATNQNHEHTSRSNLSQMLSALRLKLPTSSRPTSSTGPVITSKYSRWAKFIVRNNFSNIYVAVQIFRRLCRSAGKWICLCQTRNGFSQWKPQWQKSMAQLDQTLSDRNCCNIPGKQHSPRKQETGKFYLLHYFLLGVE